MISIKAIEACQAILLESLGRTMFAAGLTLKKGEYPAIMDKI